MLVDAVVAVLVASVAAAAVFSGVGIASRLAARRLDRAEAIVAERNADAEQRVADFPR